MGNADNCPSCSLGVCAPRHVYYTEEDHRIHIAHIATERANGKPGLDQMNCPLCIFYHAA